MSAAPFAKTIRFQQPDGTEIRLWGEGDEFRAVFETLDGYTVTFDEARKSYVYATVSADGTRLVATDLEVGKGDPQARGLAKHVRITPEAARLEARARFERWELGMNVTQRWEARKRERRMFEDAAASGPTLMSPPNFTTLGLKTGLCLLIDFDDDPATIPQAQIVDFCNGDGYRGFGNNGSVKEYYLDNSNGLLVYSNTVTAYIRIPNSLHPKSWYNDTSKDAGEQANYMIRDAIEIMKALPNYETEILPALSAVTVDDGGEITACSVYYAGGNGGRWTYGLWPHSWGLYRVGAQELSPDLKVFRYQITDIGDRLELGTFCHENGHMLCGYPDIYDYEYDSVGGAGRFCLMNSGGNGTNPTQICAYLKYASGWATTIEVTPRDNVLATCVATPGLDGFNQFYRFAKPETPTEYFLFENRQRTGRDASIPASGIAVWHIDELGDRDDQSLEYNTEHENYECTLVQADNQWHFQNDVNSGDARDLYYQGNVAEGYANAFTDTTAPSARWWDGSASKLLARDFSASDETMTFSIVPRPPVILTASVLPQGMVGTVYGVSLVAADGVKPYAWSVVSGTLPSALTLSSAGLISGMPEVAGTETFDIAVTDDAGQSVTNQFSLTIVPAIVAPYTETFERSRGIPDGWTQEFVSNTVSWTYVNGNGAVRRNPSAAHGGTNNACFSVSTTAMRGSTTRLVSPRLTFEYATSNAQVTFWHYMAKDSLFQDELTVLYKTEHAGEWLPLASYNQSVNVWTQRKFILPGISSQYYIAFEGKAKMGYGVHIDDVDVRDVPPPAFVSASPLPDAEAGKPYSFALAAAGGFAPYTFALSAGALPDGLSLSPDGVISGTSANLGSQLFTVELTDSTAQTAAVEFSLTVGLPRVELFVETFEHAGALPVGWGQQYVADTLAWTCRNGGGNEDTFHQPASAYQGTGNAVLWVSSYSDHTTRLVTPAINLGAEPSDIRLTFWHCMVGLMGRQDSLSVYYKTSASGTWNWLASYTNNVAGWTQRTLALTNLSSTCYLAFEGTARFGQGVCIDDIRITQGSLAPVILATSPLADGTVGSAYSQTLTAVGGVAPYTWERVSGAFPAGLDLSADGVLSGTPEIAANTSVGVLVRGADGNASTTLLSLKVSNVQRLPYRQNFESRSSLPLGWSQEYVPASSLNWRTYKGSSLGVPAVAHSGTNNVVLATVSTTGYKTKLVTPLLDMGVATTNAQLSFWLCMAKKSYQDELTVFYKTNAADAVWTQLAYFNKATPAWTNIVLDLPNPSPTYMLAFEGNAKYGYGVCIDDVEVTGAAAATPYELWKMAAFGDTSGEEISGDEADPDGDGIVNALEYAMGLDPWVSDTEGLPVGGVTAGYLTLSFRMDKDALDEGVLFEVEACTDLSMQDWSTVGVSERLPRADSNAWWQAIFQHDVPVTNAPQRFMRFKVSLP